MCEPPLHWPAAFCAHIVAAAAAVVASPQPTQSSPVIVIINDDDDDDGCDDDDVSELWRQRAVENGAHSPTATSVKAQTRALHSGMQQSLNCLPKILYSYCYEKYNKSNLKFLKAKVNILAPDHGWQTASARMMQHPQMLQRVTSGAEVQKGCTNCQANFLQTFKTLILLNFVNCSATAPSVIEEQVQLFWLLQLIWRYFADWYAVLHILAGLATSFHEFTTKKIQKLMNMKRIYI